MFNFLQGLKKKHRGFHEMDKDLKTYFKKLYTDYPTPAFLLNSEGVLVTCNDAMINTFGYSFKEIEAFFSTAFHQSKGAHFLKESLKGTAQTYQTNIPHKNGDQIQTDITYIPIRIEDEVIAVQGFARDITAYIQTEKDLIRIRNSLEMAQILARIGSWEYDLIEDKAYWSHQLYELLKVENSDDFVPSVTKIIHFVHPDDRSLFKETLDKSMNSMQGYQLEYRFLLRDQTIIHVQEQVKVIKDSKQQPYRIVGTIQDITDRKNNERKWKESEERFRRIYNTLEVGIWSFDIKEDFLMLGSPGIEVITGFPSKQFHDLDSWLAIIHPEDRDGYMARQSALQEGNTLRHEYRIINKNGNDVWVQDQTIPTLDEKGNLIRVDGIITDITSYKNSEKVIKHLAYHDYLTQLPNKRMLDEKLDELFSTIKNKEISISLLHLNLDRFKYVSDMLGHESGDLLIKKFANRINENLGHNTLFSRISGDEFIILLWDFEEEDAPIHVAKKILDLLKDPFILGPYEVFVTTSIGVSRYPKDIEDRGELRKSAGASLKRAKLKGRNTYEVYSPSLNIATFKRYSMERDLWKSIENKELYVEFQPKVKPDGELVGAEALVRWQHPEWGIISPREFIPLAEESGFILQIGDWVLQQVCMYLTRWEHKGLDLVPISINISAQRLLRNDWVDFIKQVLQKSKLDPKLLEIEITESTLIHYQKEIYSNLQLLEELGIRITLDDFGTGYSSLSYLKHYPVHAIKIDKSFIDHIVEDSSDQAIVRSVIQLAEDLNKNVIAEGVETMEQLNLLKKQNCQEIQGYLFSRPIRDHEFQAILQSKVLNPSGDDRSLKDPLQQDKMLRFPYPLSSEMSLTSIKGKEINLGYTEVLIEQMGLEKLRLLSSINLPVREDFTYRISITYMGQKFFCNGYIASMQEFQDIYEYDLIYVREQDGERWTQAFSAFAEELKNNQLPPDTPFMKGDRQKYLLERGKV
ncbi:EAL domain-containing protein [Radiobacillus kanasensis]|uniref:sensor domain-containing protein n=1 Tax=Radiobacillus kanasensis TaxID=2844358 RepID=UPI001E283A00|nr:bifunctional diguanylate cyclase/phosphodiesterase [Radiobacillus kanasensis]UFT98963.1 EAL domain-containing protein [Radiobacillus kanasensis]